MIQLKSISLEQQLADDSTSTNNNKRKRKSEIKATYWQGIVDDWIASGLTKKIFCEENNVSFSALSYWRNRLSKESRRTGKKSRKRIHNQRHEKKIGAKAELPFSQLTVTLPQETAASSLHIEIITPSDYKVRLPVSIDTVLFKNLLITLGVCHA